jgi:hypothetical protein
VQFCSGVLENKPKQIERNKIKQNTKTGINIPQAETDIVTKK